MADRCALVKGFSLDACCGGSTCSSCCVVCKPPLVKPVPPPNHNESVAVRWCCCRDGSSCSHSSWVADASCSEFRPSKGTQTFIELTNRLKRVKFISKKPRPLGVVFWFILLMFSPGIKTAIVCSPGWYAHRSTRFCHRRLVAALLVVQGAFRPLF